MRLYRLTDEILHYLWDPIGVAGIAEARDEYYAYLPEVFGLLLAAKNESEIAAYLTRVESQRMGGTPDNTSNIKIAGMLIDARKALLDHGS
ncbi:hypothetical protein C84B14_08587 [Salinisphaera sp. C84B14]